MKNLAIIPARSGSKGLKDKNIKMLSGKPLMAYTIEAAIESKMFCKVMVSTDSGNYAEIAREYGAEVPFLRSNELSGDKAGSWEVVLEVLQQYQTVGEIFDTVCLLQPTSPLRDSADIIQAYSEMKDKNAEAITSVCEAEHSPLWMMTLDESLSLETFNQNASKVPRQALTQYYRLNGAIYLRKVEYNGDEIKILNSNDYAYIMDKQKSIDIDDINDFVYAEFLHKRNEA